MTADMKPDDHMMALEQRVGALESALRSLSGDVSTLAHRHAALVGAVRQMAPPPPPVDVSRASDDHLLALVAAQGPQAEAAGCELRRRQGGRP